MSMMIHRHKKRIREEKSSLAPVSNTDTVVEQDNAQYSKSEINRMAVDDLRKIATENGVEDAENVSGADLKKILIEKFGL